jgi:hypothetical protein
MPQGRSFTLGIGWIRKGGGGHAWSVRGIVGLVVTIIIVVVVLRLLGVL